MGGERQYRNTMKTKLGIKKPEKITPQEEKGQKIKVEEEVVN